MFFSKSLKIQGYLSIFKSRTIFFNLMQEFFIGIDLGGTKCAGAVISIDGIILHKSVEKIAGLKNDMVSNQIHLLITKLTDTMDRPSQLTGIGISIPGISYQDKGTVWAPNIPGWDNYPLIQDLKDKLGEKLTIHIDSDRACSIGGEVWLGAAKGVRNAIFLAFGTGIGAGLLIDGRILRGKDDIAGSIGWLALDDQFPDGYKQFGCFEYNASGDGLARLCWDLYTSNKPVTTLNMEMVEAKDIFLAYDEGDPLAVQTIETAIEYWAKAVANLVSIFNPEVIIFGGGVFGPGLKFLDQIYQRSKQWAQPVAIEQVRLVGGELGVNAQLFGAVRLVMDKLLESNN
jgi:glucokinase